MDQSMTMTGYGLRKSIGFTALTLPLLVQLLGGSVMSLSASYYTPAHDTFIGALALISAFLFAYRGYDRRDLIAARVAAGAAALVGICPTAPFGTHTWQGTIHGLAALVFFLALAYFCLVLFPLGSNPMRNRVYKICGYWIVAATVISAWGILAGAPGRFVFWFESMAVWSFGLAWLLKGWRPPVSIT